MRNLLEQLRQAILDSDLTFRELEDKTGIPHSAIQRYISGNVRVPFDRMEALAEAVGFDFSQAEEESERRKEKTSFYERVNKLCIKNSISITALAIELGFSKGTPTNWKNMDTAPHNGSVKKIADRFGVSTDYLLGRTDDTQAAQPTQERRDENAVGERLRRLREENGYTMDELAQMLDVATQTIYKYEKGIVTNIPLENIEKIARILGVTPAYLTGWTDDENTCRIAELRKRKGITQDELASQMNISRSTLAMWETGKSEPNREALVFLADFFGVSTDYILGRTDDLFRHSVQKQEPPEPEPKNAFAVIDHQLDTFLQETEEYHNYLKQATKLMTGAVNAAHALKHYLKKLEAFEKDRY